MRKYLVASLALALVASLDAQRTLIVDGTGAGQFKKISAAVAAAKDGDLILVRKGFYIDTVVVDRKEINIMGAGASAGEVVLQGVGSTALTIRNHPAGKVSRFSRFTVRGSTRSIAAHGNRGDLFFQQIHAVTEADIQNHDGIVSISQSTLRSTGTVLRAIKVKNLFGQGTVFRTSALNNAGVVAANVLQNTHAHFAHCSMNGSTGGRNAAQTYAGGPALTMRNSVVRISGLKSDSFQGGDGVTSGTNTTPGGVGVALSLGSQLLWSGAAIDGGVGALSGNKYRSPPFSTDPTSRASPLAMPVLVVRPTAPPAKAFARRAKTEVDVHFTASSLSLTWLAIEYGRPLATVWGYSVIDLGKPTVPFLLRHDSAGRARFPVDLRNLPASFVGLPFVAQTLAVDIRNILVFSGPLFGAIGH